MGVCALSETAPGRQHVYCAAACAVTYARAGDRGDWARDAGAIVCLGMPTICDASSRVADVPRPEATDSWCVACGHRATRNTMSSQMESRVLAQTRILFGMTDPPYHPSLECQ